MCGELMGKHTFKSYVWPYGYKIHIQGKAINLWRENNLI